MFPFNGDCGGLEYFSQKDLAYISPNVRPAPGADGTPGGSMELNGRHDSFIEIGNFDGGYADTRTSITILAFVFPLGDCGPIITYGTCGYGVQIWQEPLEPEYSQSGTGTLAACFVTRDLTVAIPIRKAVLNINAWNYIGASYDYTTGIARLWHNGEEVEALLIGPGFELATQFPIRIGALDNPWQEHFFTGRISHLHIYSEALTVENIQAVGCNSEKGRFLFVVIDVFKELRPLCQIGFFSKIDKCFEFNEKRTYMNMSCSSFLPLLLPVIS